jgi:type VI secretion system protein ImpG
MPARDELRFYYEEELAFLRRSGAEFAQRYPKIAGRLQLEANKCEDPHVERLLEGFAFLAARVHLKIDDEFPEIVEALFSILYPHYIRPVPSMSIVQFFLDPDQGKMTTGFNVPRGSFLYTAPVNGMPCKFRTCFDATLWPLRVHAAEWKSADRLTPPVPAMNSVAALRLEIHCFQDVTFSKLDLNTLRVFLTGDGGITHSLIELLSNNCIQIVARDLSSPAKKVVYLSPENVRQAGLAEGESLIPFPHRSFWGYRLIQEYFSFPEKFLFLDLSGFDRLAAAGFGDKVELIFLISDFERPERKQTLERGLSETTFGLGCAPIVNLFDQIAEPVLIEQKRYEYRIVPDARREQAVDIFSVDKVSGVMGSSGEIVEYEPFYSYRHSRGNGRGGHEKEAFYHVSRRPSSWRTDKGSDVYISFVDLTGQKTTPGRDSITVRLTCSNRDLPARLPFGNPEGDFQLEGGGPITRIVALVNPTKALQPPERSSLLWRLVSQMSLNYLSIVGEGVDAFREILRLHNFGESVSAERQIDSILSIDSRPHFTRLVSEHGVSFVRGTQVEIEFDEEQFAGSGVYSFCAMLDVFLGLYTSVNSFSQLVTRTRQRKGVMKRWPPRAGRKILM